MKENINTADIVLSRMSIIDKARALAWYQDVDFEPAILVNVDHIWHGTERFYVTGATIEDVFAYPKTIGYAPKDAELLEHWSPTRPWIERDDDSKELERILDERLRVTGIDKDNPLVKSDYQYCPNEIIFKGTGETN